MTAPALYAFRKAGTVVNYYVLDSTRRIRITSETERLQLGIDAADIHVLDTSNFLVNLPIANP
jgi:hypothetical protein